MKHIIITAHTTGHRLYEGFHPSFKSGLECAVRDRVALDNINLSRRNLSNANLDGAQMAGGDFSLANLSGANMSEGVFNNGRFVQASLFNSCLAHSNLQNCDFSDASFGASDMAGSDISGSVFSSLSCFSIDFNSIWRMDGCLFKDASGEVSMMSRPPLIIHGLCVEPLVALDCHIKIGHQTLPARRPSHYPDPQTRLKYVK